MSQFVTPRFKTPRKDSQKHLALVRQLPSCLSFCSGPNDPHHLRCKGGRGAGMKAEDCWTVPLTRGEHTECHTVGSKKELEWFYQRGIDVSALAAELWSATGNLETMTEIVRIHHANIDRFVQRQQRAR